MVLAHNIDEGLRTQDIQISQDITFDTMLLASNTLRGLKNSGFYKPSPVQLHGIPLGKCGFDLLLEAKSGTGKTAVFSIIALEKLDINNGLQTIILAPTREIASQICDVVKQIGANYPGLVVEVVMGGLPVVDDVEKFKKNVHIVVGSPGRLRHLIQDKHIDISSVRLLILDEADKLMEKSFLPDINYIFSILPKDKQVIMSSATYLEATKIFINKYVKCAQHVCPDSNCILLGVEQKITVVKSNCNIVRQTEYRFKELLKILSKKQFKQCLIFCNYQARVNELYKLLNREKWPVEQLCGQQEQTDRLDALKTLQEYKCRILISTDLAARGIDASNVDLVINFEPPFEWQTYLHRIGRAGRYGSYGMAITILSEKKEEDRFKKLMQSINLDTLKITQFWKADKTVENTTDQPCLATSSNITPECKLDNTGFWKTLIGDPSIEREIDDFQELCKSYQAFNQPEIECFTDLINSYKACNEKDSINQNVSIKPTGIKHVTQPLKSLEASINSKPEVIKAKEKKYIDKLNNYKIENENNDLNVDRLSTNYIENDDTYSYDEIETQSSNRALINAGLPLSFGHPKKISDSQANKSKAAPRKLPNKYNYKDFTKNKVKENNIISYQSQTHETFQKRKETIHNKNVKGGKKETSQKNYNQNYIQWYNQLKIRVKQIELAVYLDELSRQAS